MPTSVEGTLLQPWDLREPGTYLLFLYLAERSCLEVGRLGRYDLPVGWYVYAGSALAGLGPRLRRHRRREKSLRWHIDWLREVSALRAIAWRSGPERIECDVAALLAMSPLARSHMPRFGASDCRCASHLYYFASWPDITPGPEWTYSEVTDGPDADTSRVSGVPRPTDSMATRA